MTGKARSPMVNLPSVLETLVEDWREVERVRKAEGREFGFRFEGPSELPAAQEPLAKSHRAFKWCLLAVYDFCRAESLDTSPLWRLDAAFDGFGEVTSSKVEDAVVASRLIAAAWIRSGQQFDVDSEATPSISDRWSAPDSPRQWGIRFGCSVQTLKNRVRRGELQIRKLSSKSWQILAKQVPSEVQIS